MPVVDTSALQDAVSSSAPVLADIASSPAVQEAAVTAAAYATDATSATLQALSVWAMDRLAVVQVRMGGAFWSALEQPAVMGITNVWNPRPSHFALPFPLPRKKSSVPDPNPFHETFIADN